MVPRPSPLALAVVVALAPSAALAQGGGGRAPTPAQEAGRLLDAEIARDRFLDAARDARGDARTVPDGALARTDALDADRGSTVTERALRPDVNDGSPVSPQPSLGDNVQR